MQNINVKKGEAYFMKMLKLVHTLYMYISNRKGLELQVSS